MPLLSPALPAAAQEAWRWWTSELRGMLPAELRLPRNAVPYSDIWAYPNGITIERVRDGAGAKLAHELPLDAVDEDGWAELGALIEGTRTRVLLSPPETYSTVLTLPAAARRRLQPALVLQLGQIAPADPSLIVWKSKLLDATKTSLSVLVVMARRSRIEAVQSLFFDHGIPAPPIFATTEHGPVRLAAGFEGRHGARPRADLRACAFAALLVASIPVTTLMGAKLMTSIIEARNGALEQELAPRMEAQRRFVRAEQLRRALKPLFEQTAATDVIENLALALPETAYATQIGRGEDARLQVTIDAGDADAVSTTMAKNRVFEAAETTDMAPANGGRIQISYQWTGS